MIKKYLLSLIIVSFLFVGILPVSALEIEDYPTVFGLEIHEGSSLPEYVIYIFRLAMTIAGVVALLAFIFGALRYITSAGNPEKISDAKSRMISSILGLGLVLISFIIISNIDMDIKELEAPELKRFAGVYFVDHIDEEEREYARPAQSVSSSEGIDEKYKYILNDCPAGEDNTIYIHGYGERRHQSPEFTRTLECGESEPLEPHRVGRSFRIEWQRPGVYFCAGASCSNDGYRMYSRETYKEDLSPPFRDNIKGIEIINDPENKMFFGTILGYSYNFYHSQCSDVIFSNREESLEQTVNGNTRSIVVFQWEPDKEAGEFVYFWSRPWGEMTKESYFYRVKPESTMDNGEISIRGIYNEDGYLELDPQIEMEYEEFWGNPPTGLHRIQCKTVSDCPGSMIISGSFKRERGGFTKGDYMVIIFSHARILGTQCYPFQNSHENLGDHFITGMPVLGAGRDLTKIIIIPVK